MIDLKDLLKPPVMLAMAGSAALGFAAGYLLGRDPRLLRRALAAAAHSWEQTRLAVAETREELADHWAEAREQARHDIEEAAFAAATTEVAVEPAPAPSGEAPKAKARKASRGGRRGSARRTGARSKPTTH